LLGRDIFGSPRVAGVETSLKGCPEKKGIGSADKPDKLDVSLIGHHHLRFRPIARLYGYTVCPPVLTPMLTFLEEK
jgi:hypothetical protein